jgi:predicted nucleic acid-binding protein
MRGKSGGRFFLDTNIFVYCFNGDAAGKRNRALQLVREAVSTRRGIVSYQVVQEFFNVALRRFMQPISHAEAEQYLGTVFRPLLAVHSSLALYQQALAISQRYQFNWFDALIVTAAQIAECRLLYTEDLQHGQELEGVRVENPFL